MGWERIQIGICKGGNSFSIKQTMTQGYIRIRPTRPSVGLTRGIHCKMIISVLPHSSRSKAVCVQNVICLLKSLCSTFTNILCYVDKFAGYSYRRIADTKIYSHVCLACTCRASCTGSASVGLNQIFLLSSMGPFNSQNCHNLLFRQGSQDSL